MGQKCVYKLKLLYTVNTTFCIFMNFPPTKVSEHQCELLLMMTVVAAVVMVKLMFTEIHTNTNHPIVCSLVFYMKHDILCVHYYVEYTQIFMNR